MKKTTLGELSLKLGINKSKLWYYYTIGLIVPIQKAGSTNIFDEKEVLNAVKRIAKLKEKGKKLRDFKKK